MNQLTPNRRDHEWLAYYDRFDYFSAATVRDGCYPRIMEHQQPREKAIVLVHGLCDSPYFMTAIGEYFFDVLGYNVYLPLLHCHGLKQPNGMEGVSLDEWKANVNFAIDRAAAKAKRVSIGGLSTGGTLSLYAAVNNPKINGTLYLFSAALDLAGGLFGIQGELKEILLRTFLADILDSDKPLIGNHPYRYAHMDLDGARELSKAIAETDDIIRAFMLEEPFAKPIFAAHSESDVTASISGIEDLQQVSIADRFTFFRISKMMGVAHASLVLKEPIYAIDAHSTDEPLQLANPMFPEMLDAIAAIS
jgi:pimeloyl-ACP methyl ester carboxylesterase